MAEAKKDQEANYTNFLEDAKGSLPDDVPFSDLDNDVHPHFQKASFTFSDADGNIDDIEDDTYQAMLPALRLASILITEPAMLPVFDHIANGFINGDSHGKLYVANGSLENASLGHSYIHRVFLAMDPDVLFIFTSEASHTLSPAVHASTLVTDHASPSKRPYLQKPLKIPGQSSPRCITSSLAIVSIREYFYTYFRTRHRTTSRARHLAALLSFTNTLLHELVHAFALFTQNGIFTASLALEPRFSRDLPLREYGRAYESWLWGGPMLFDVACPSISAENATPKLPPEMLVLAAWSEKMGRVRCEWTEGGEMVVGTARGMGLWFLKGTWERVRREGGNGWVLGEMGRDRLVVGDGRVRVLFYGVMRRESVWGKGIWGFGKWFVDWKHKQAQE